MNKNYFWSLLNVAKNRGLTLKDLSAYARAEWGEGYLLRLPDYCYDLMLAWLAKKKVKTPAAVKGFPDI